MKLSLIIAALREWCPSFGEAGLRRVAAAKQFKPIPENQHFALPAAYVMPWQDEADGGNQSQTGYRQTLVDGFSVVLVLDNTAGEYSPEATDKVHDLRAEVFGAVLGWEPSDDYEPIEYKGGGVEYVDRARLYYRLDFAATTEITVEQTRHARDLAALPRFENVGFGIDALDPADPNRATPGPDGRFEAGAEIDVT